MNIFEISKKLEDIFFEIEENGGEVNDEILKELEIHQEELKDKLDSYRKAYSYYKSQVEAAKAEETRIANVRKTYEKRNERLKDVMMNAVLEFGDTSKSGNKIVELPDAKLFTKSTSCTEFDEFRVMLLKTIPLQILETMYNNDTLNPLYGEYTDEQFLTDIKNKAVDTYPNQCAEILEAGESILTKDDLYAAKFTISVDVRLADLITHSKWKLLDSLFDSNETLNVDFNMSKTDIKSYLNTSIYHITFAKNKSGVSLVIK